MATTTERTPLIRRVARLRLEDPSQIDGELVFEAVGHVQRRSRELYDAFASCGQIVENTPRRIQIAVMYGWLRDQA